MLPSYSVMRLRHGLVRLLLPFIGVAPTPGATLEQMSLDDLVEKSTAIVRARAGDHRAVQDGALIYTHTAFEVVEQWKGEPLGRSEVALPGGRVGGLSQRFGGVPELEKGKEYVIFLWRGPSGRTQITGLSQGLFEVELTPNGEVLVRRKPNADLLLQPGSSVSVPNAGITMPLDHLAAQVRTILQDRGAPAP